MTTRYEKALLKLSLPTYIESKQDLKTLLQVAKVLGNLTGTSMPEDHSYLVAMNAISDICKPFNLIRKELELQIERLEVK